MKKFFKFVACFTVLAFTLQLGSCSKDDDPDMSGSGQVPPGNGDNDENEPGNNPDDNIYTAIIGFQNVPEDYFASSAYGPNLYDGSITKGYIAPLYENTYAQFPINYGGLFYAGYSFYNGGIALSKYHDMTLSSYENQLSVYNSTSPSGGNFAVSNGYSYYTFEDPMESVYEDYVGCGRVFITDAEGYDAEAEDDYVSGVAKTASFKTVEVANTTYTYLTMKNGDGFASALTPENKGWFKVQFLAFADDDQEGSPLGCVEYYLANFNESLNNGVTGISENWETVDLSTLPACSILVINFVGSDTGDWGLNTPGYCALDNFVISVEKE
ncbi:MAG: DUF4465 domain-containing protein [Muribaculaceae bacterium]|nr:DUF4465 domain-containing protein [Muribaculaceae bacterium]